MSPLSVPNFLIIGAAKAATTSLSSLLEQHPEAAIARPKEPHFFSYDQYYRFGWDAYLRLFSHAEGRRAIGDSSTSYSRIRHHPQAIARIQRHLGTPRIIYMVRHPLERMESAYVEHLRNPGAAFGSINEAVEQMPMILDSSRYWEVYDAYRRAFGEANLQVVWFEDYKARPLESFQAVCRFLDIDEGFVPDLQRQVANSRQEALAQAAELNRALPAVDMVWRDETRRRVVEALREDSLRFLDHFGKPADHWGPVFA